MSKAQQSDGRPAENITRRSWPPWPVTVAGVLGVAAAGAWLVGIRYFWYYHPLAPLMGSLAYGVAVFIAWRRGDRAARIIATAFGVGEGLSYGPGGLVADALFLASSITLYLPPSNAYFRRRGDNLR